MAKSDLYRYLENKQRDAVKLVNEKFKEQYDLLENKKLEQFGVREEAHRLRELGMEVFNKHLAWAEQFETTDSSQSGDYPKYQLHAYNGVLRAVSGGNYFNLTENENEIYNSLKKFIQLGDKELIDLKNKWSEVKHNTEVEYNKLIAVCKETRSTAKLIEYLVSLGFDETEVTKLVSPSVSTALSTHINSELLFIGGVNHG